jgi:hypothetical protein
MTTPKDLSSYGGPYVDAHAVKDPTSQMAASYGNRIMEDLAQMTRVYSKIWLQFPTVASGTTTVTAHVSAWGTGAGFHPTTIERTGVGEYDITYPASFDDGLSVTETVSFTFAEGCVASTTVYGRVQAVAASNVITVVVLDDTDSPVDLTAGTVIQVVAR